VVHGTVKGLLGLISSLVLIAAISAAALAYRLSQGPLSLSLLTPAIEQALGRASGGLNITLADTVLQWDAQDGALSVHIRDIRTLGPDGRALASVPEATVSISGPALLLGQVTLRGLRLIQPHLHVLRDAQSGYAFAFGDQADLQSAAILDKAIVGAIGLAQSPQATAPQQGAGPSNRGAGAIERVEIVDGDLAFEDAGLGIRWHAPKLNLVVMRSKNGVSAAIRGPLDMGGQAATLNASMLMRGNGGTISGTVRWTGVRPSDLARLASALQPLARLPVVSNGNADFDFSPGRGVTRLAVDLATGPGTVDAAPWLAGGVRVTSASLRGTVSDGFDSVVLDGLHVDLGGPKIAISGRATGLNGTPHVAADASVDGMPIEQLKALWPEALAPNPRSWIVANISGGVFRHGDIKLAATVPLSGGEPQVESASGQMVAEGLSVHYLGTMPSVHGAAGTGVFDKDSLTLTVKGGNAAGIAVTGGTIKLSGFNDPEAIGAFNLAFEGTVADTLKLIDAKPLGYASALGFDPARAKGDAKIGLDMRFPLVKTLRLAQVKLHAHAQTQHLAIPKAALGLDLSDGALVLDVDPHGMDIAGTAELGPIPIELKWRENFASAAFVSRYEVKAKLDDAGRKAVGLDDPAFQAPVIGGAVPVEAVATLGEGGRGEAVIKADLTPAQLRLPGLNWSKPAGVSAAADATLRINPAGIVAVPHFSVSGQGGLEIKGDAAFDGAGHPRRISLSTAKWGRTDLRGTILFKPDGSLGIDLSGASFDASELANGGNGEHHVEERVPLSASAKLGRIWLSEDGSIRDVSAVLARGRRHWRFIRADATVGGRGEKPAPLHIDVRPTDDSHRSLKVTSADAGATFGAFGVLKNMRGGTLTIDGTYDDVDPRGPLAGTVKITDYQVVKAPLLARILTVASLTGAADVLGGSGIHFAKADAPFTLVDSVVTLKDARTSGTEIGLTANGQIDLERDQLALEGTIVPAYAINSIVGDIPLIGSLLAGEKGGGLIAFSYSVKGPSASPDVSVNPLSALTPGFLRGLFGVFDSGNGTKVAPRNAPKPPDQAPDGTDR
jgi:hypothetical protein